MLKIPRVGNQVIVNRDKHHDEYEKHSPNYSPAKAAQEIASFMFFFVIVDGFPASWTRKASCLFVIDCR